MTQSLAHCPVFGDHRRPPVVTASSASAFPFGSGQYCIGDRVYVRGGRGAHFEITGFADPVYSPGMGLWVANGLLVGSDKNLISATSVLGKVPPA
jgi:hypothetical protein